jgi:hypothetical protein
MSSTINQMLDIALPSSLAAVHKDSSFRLYATATDGGIHEARYDGSWTGGSSNDVIATGKLGSPVAAAAIGLDTIRVYYLSSNSILQEAGSDDGRRWCDGDLGKAGFAVALYSGLAAVFLGGKPVIRVYAQMSKTAYRSTVMTTTAMAGLWVPILGQLSLALRSPLQVGIAGHSASGTTVRQLSTSDLDR